jgi:hypothetical protein
MTRECFGLDNVFEEILFAAGMATAKLNKEKLKRVMEQKDAVPVSLGKKHRGDLTSRSTSFEAVVCPMIAPMPAPVVQAPTSLVEVVEPVEVPSSSRVVEKAPTLALDAFLALRQAKSVVTKEDVDDYAKLNTDVVKRALAHSLMKVCRYHCHLYVCRLSFYVLWLFVGFDGGYGCRQPVYAMGGGHCEVEIAVDGCLGCQPNFVVYRCGLNS